MCEVKYLFDLSEIRSEQGSEAMMLAWQSASKKDIRIIDSVTPDSFTVKEKYSPLITSLKYLCCANCPDSNQMSFDDIKIIRDLHAPNLSKIAQSIENAVLDYIQWVDFEKRQHSTNMNSFQEMLLTTIHIATT
jgi:hypothetical protein